MLRQEGMNEVILRLEVAAGWMPLPKLSFVRHLCEIGL